MAGPTIDQAFVRQFEREVHEEYQRMGSLCRGTVRTVNNVKGESTTFQKVGSGSAVSKARHGQIPPANLDHTPVVCPMVDSYFGEWCDKLDEMKINHDERRVIINAAAYALGRKTDDQIITAANTTTTTEGGAAALLTYKRVLTALEVLRSNDIRFDGGLYGWLTPHQEAALLANEAQFSNTDYIETSILGAPYRMRNWLNVKWLTHTGLPSVGTASARCFVWHQTAIGHGIQATATTDIQYYNTHAAHFIQSHLSQGAVLIDTRGVCRIDVDDTVAI